MAGYIKKISIQNGNRYEPFYIYQCVNCGQEVPESSPHIYKDEGCYCWDCSFLTKLISEEEYIKLCGIYLDNVHAGVIDGKVVVYIGKNPPWIRRSDREERHSSRYKEWRIAVFQRDNYDCQDCGQKGGKLNAHHIKSFKNFPKLRYEINNGVTLCEKCHRKRHKERVSV